MGGGGGKCREGGGRGDDFMHQGKDYFFTSNNKEYTILISKFIHFIFITHTKITTNQKK